LRHHLFDLILKQKEQGFYVHSENAVEISLSLLYEQPVFTGDPSIVECKVETSEGFESEWHNPPHLLRLTEICLDEGRRSAVVSDVVDKQPRFALPPSCNDYLST
jgi:hypothetical protein